MSVLYLLLRCLAVGPVSNAPSLEKAKGEKIGGAGRRHRIRLGPRTNGVMFVRRRSVLVVYVVMAVLFVSMYVRRSISCQLMSLCVDHMSTYVRTYVIVSIQHDLMSIGVDLC